LWVEVYKGRKGLPEPAYKADGLVVLEALGNF